MKYFTYLIEEIKNAIGPLSNSSTFNKDEKMFLLYLCS